MFEHVWMHHAAAQHFQPAGVRADTTAAATADDAANIHFSRRFGEWKERRPKTHGQFVHLEKPADEIRQHALEIGKRH